MERLDSLAGLGPSSEGHKGLALVSLKLEDLRSPADLKAFLAGRPNISVVAVAKKEKADNRTIAELLEAGADLAVLDINMPEMDGIELLGHIRTDGRFKETPVLLLTIRAFTEDQVQGYDRGADDYLTKPFDNDVLVARVKVLERRILGNKP